MTAQQTAIISLAIFHFLSARFCFAEESISDGSLTYVPSPENAAQVGQALIYGKPAKLSRPLRGSSTTHGPLPAKALDGSLPDDATSFTPVFTNFGVDVTQIRSVELGRPPNTVTQLATKLTTIESGLAGMNPPRMIPLGTVWDTYNTTKNMSNAWEVSAGIKDPTSLQSVAPSVVMGWKALRGPENTFLPRTIDTGLTWKDGGSSFESMGATRITEVFRSSQPGHIGRWGFDAAHDSYMRTITSHSVTHDVLNGARFNSWYQQQNFNIPSFDY